MQEYVYILLSSCHLLHFDLIFSNDLDEKVTIEVDPELETVTLNRDQSGDLSFSENFAGIQKAPLHLKGDSLDIRVFVDESSIEFFAGNYQTIITSTHFPTEPFTNIKLVTSGATYFGTIKVHDLSSIWPVN